MSALIGVSNITKQFSGEPLFSGLSFTVLENERIGVIGPNGKGKSTFLKILSGIEDIDEGNLSKAKNLITAYAPQLVPYSQEATVQTLIDDEYIQKSTAGLEVNVNEIISLLDQFGITEFNTPMIEFSGGQRKKIQLSFVLAEHSDLLLLDEPSNHLDFDSILQLEEVLKGLSKSVVMITHDRSLLESFAQKILEINPIYPEGYFISEGNYSKYIERRDAFLEADAKAITSMKNKARVELAWLRQGVKARTTKAKYRQDSAEALLENVKSHSARRQQKTAHIEFISSERKTKDLVEFKGVSHSFDDRPLFKPFDYVVKQGKKIGILGPNGSGKSTILKLILGEFPPTKGEVRLVGNLKVSYFSQFSSQIPDDLSLERALAPEGDSVLFKGNNVHVAAWATRFGFDPKGLKQSYGTLSGGQKARLRIAKLMLDSPDILLLDEPTNDLDIATLEVLEESLLEFDGALLLVTHDRFMLSNICDTFLGLNGQGSIAVFASLQQYMVDYKAASISPAFKNNNNEIQTTKTPSSNDKPKKLSYKEQREYDQIESLIAAAEAEVSKISDKISAPTSDDDLQKLCEQLNSAQAKVDKLYTRWEELELKLKAHT